MSARILRLNLQSAATAREQDVRIDRLIIAGWTGRDRTALEAHIVELEALGVRRPSSTPIFYRVAAARLTLDDSIEAAGEHSSGEVEFVLAQVDGRLWVGVGSDHTDRKVETYGVTVSKQMCEKPIGRDFWAFDDVAGHWDDLILRSFVVENGRRVAYQEGRVTAMTAPRALIALAPGGKLDDGAMMFCGTLAVHGGIRPAPRFEFELHDPVLNRTIRHGYAVQALPIVD